MRVDIISYHVHCHHCICLCTPGLLDQEDWFIYLHAFPSCISLYNFNSVGVLLLVSSLQVPLLATPCYTCSSHCNTINCWYSYTKKWSVYTAATMLPLHFFPADTAFGHPPKWNALSPLWHHMQWVVILYCILNTHCTFLWYKWKKDGAVYRAILEKKVANCTAVC